MMKYDYEDMLARLHACNEDFHQIGDLMSFPEFRGFLRTALERACDVGKPGKISFSGLLHTVYYSPEHPELKINTKRKSENE